MLAKILNNNIPTLNFNSTIEDCLDIFNHSEFEYLPVLNGKLFIGTASYEEVELYDLHETISVIQNTFTRISVTELSLLTDIVEGFLKIDQNLIPIVNGMNEYQGCVLWNELKDYCSNHLLMLQDGVSFDIKLPIDAVDISKITYLIESEGAKIYSILTTFSQEEEAIYVSIKINKNKAYDVLSLLRINKYEVKDNVLVNDTMKEMYQKRIDEFFKYLNI